MNAASPEPLTWSLQRWFLFFLLVFASQLVLIFFLSSRKSHSSPVPLVARTTFQTISGHLSEAKLLESGLVSDPSLFAMANVQGFSGAAWLKRSPSRYELSEQHETPFWLTLNTSHLGTAISQFVRNDLITPVSLQQDAPPQLHLALVPDATAMVRSNSRFRVEGAIASRLAAFPPLKSLATNEIFNETVAQVAVDPDGLVVSARLLEKSGFPEADRSALEIARRLSFLPMRTGGIVWGKLIFDWHTVPGNGTNDIPKAIQP